MQKDFSYDYLSAMPLGGQQNSNSKIENYKRIKQEEAAARAMLLAPSRLPEPTSATKIRNSDQLGSIGVHRRHPSSFLDQRYKPSENALAQYSPLRNQLSQQQIPQFIPSVKNVGVGVISSQELRGLRQII